MDLGYGTLSRLLALVDSRVGAGIDAVVITHQHPDHVVDLHGLFRARWFGDRDADRIPLYAPEGVVQRLQGLEEDDEDAILRVFDWHRLPGEETYEVGPFELRGWSLPHFVPNAGVRLTADGLVVAYTGDTGPDPSLAELARDADLFIAEASDRHQRADTPAAGPGPRMHLTARDAGEAAQAAGAKRLLLTRFWPGNDRETSLREAARSSTVRSWWPTRGCAYPCPDSPARPSILLRAAPEPTYHRCAARAPLIEETDRR